MQQPITGFIDYVSDHFTRQAQAMPGRIALEDDKHSYTYKQFDTLTNQIAQYLQQRGIGPEVVVACHLSRSSAIAIFCLAILKAGGTYLLVDPKMPLARRRYIIKDAKPRLIVSDSADKLSSAKIGFITVQEVYKKASTCSNMPVAHALHPKNAAYIAYTSGSTGQPKGVVVMHESLTNHALYFVSQFQLSPDDRVPLMAPIAFDMATEEMIPPLLAGCTLVVAKSVYKDMADFTEEIRVKQYSVLNIPAPLWHEWSGYMYAHSLTIPPRLRLIITGSDKVYTHSYLRWRSLAGSEGVDWAAAYGTTETTVTSTFYLTAATDDLSDEPIMPIGKPIAHTQAYILDAAGKPTGVGEVGELYIGGRGVARGYLNLPDKTASSFKADVFSNETGAYMYKTGDLARFRKDGTIVCLGRKDFQVKIRGLRIELGEIETTIETLPMVTDAVVLLCQTGTDETSKCLVAFATTTLATPPPQESILDTLRASLHPFMVPHCLEWLSEMPLNTTGKIDRNALQNKAEQLAAKRTA